MDKFLAQFKIHLEETRLRARSMELFAKLQAIPHKAHQMLDSFMRDPANVWYRIKGVDEAQLREDLYKITYYNWGGDKANSLDRHLVSRYVKAVASFDKLCRKRTKIEQQTWNYVEVSWYNNWSSYLIESIFCKHHRVIPAIGEIRGVDFFIDDIPLDLKVTFFPDAFMQDKLEGIYHQREVSWLKRQANAANITYDIHASESQIVYAVTEKLRESSHDDVLRELQTNRRRVFYAARQEPSELIRWLYEHQGSMRFGVENRLFVVLVDSDDMDASWKLKRDFDFLHTCIHQYLDNFNAQRLTRVDFEYEGNKYSAYADILFIEKRKV